MRWNLTESLLLTFLHLDYEVMARRGRTCYIVSQSPAVNLLVWTLRIYITDTNDMAQDWIIRKYTV